MNWLGQSSRRIDEDMEASTNRKRLALILRYIASMHHSSDSNGNNSSGSKSNNGIRFIREYVRNNDKERLLQTEFFQREVEIDIDNTNFDEVLFSTSDFRRLVEDDSSNGTQTNSHILALSLFSVPPFSFYASYSSTSSNSLLSTTFKKSHQSLENDGKGCWLRLTRLTADTKPKISNHQGVENYLRQWANQMKINNYNDLLTLQKLQNAPKLGPNAPHRDEIQSFMRKYKKYLRRDKVRMILEPIYNLLFEWMQQRGSGSCDGDEELIWGFGNARMARDGKVVNGPLLEVMVEVELARDGALLIRPRVHTGVSLNREVVSFLGTTEGSSSDILSDLYRTASEMETNQLCPAQPKTYSAILKRIAYELSPGGKYQQHASSIQNNFFDTPNNNLIVTDSWCLYRRLKPRTLWARDASALEARLLSNNNTTLHIPKATYALTHGPGYFAESVGNVPHVTSNDGAPKRNEQISMFSSLKSAVFGESNAKNDHTPTPCEKPLFPLPTSEVQTRIADLMLNKNYPAVVCEGPPGTGKTHTIANILCAYLCCGKRVLITSKGSPALSVLRNRLPKSVQELSVDASMSETAGMRQLQQTVEHLADKVSRVSSDIELEKCQLIKHQIETLQQELFEINDKLLSHSERKREIISSRDGQQLTDVVLSLLENAPWLVKSLASWTIADVRTLHQRVDFLFIKDDHNLYQVSNYPSPPDDALINRVAIESGETLSCMKNTARSAISSIPMFGGLLSNGSSTNDEELTDRMNDIKVNNRYPCDKSDWQLVLRALRHDKAIHEFHDEVIEPFGWPIDKIYEMHENRRKLGASFFVYLGQILLVKELTSKLNLTEENEILSEIATLDRRRSKISEILQQLSEELVEAKIVTQLSQMFSTEAQSALIKFSQIAGKAKFNKSTTQSKMSQRQRRHRQEYLNCFEQCVPYIPCWILTSSQINDYLPPEFGLFDLVVIDEASQSDVTVLPGMLRGKQWLIVGDGKQVSPSEAFISESQINSLRAALPQSPLEDSLLPGHSFFDLSAQCFPRGRVVLREHFRCAPEIIRFSNDQFYASRLVPLRLPTSIERMTPSLIDVRVEGLKSGKVNEIECSTIVSMIQEMVLESSNNQRRSIGIISLVGNDQSRLIRSRLLDAIGPQKYKEHNILVGDPPIFQGAERDCIFLTMVCSPGNVPSQSQLMHAQRANVALSRARDRMVLVRSIDVSHVVNPDDVKVEIIEFFMEDEIRLQNNVSEPLHKSSISFRFQIKKMIESRLEDDGYGVRRMGVVLKDAISVESEKSGNRAAICIVSAGESKQEWLSMLVQQKSIERVGWNCMRVDALNCLLDFEISIKSIVNFLISVDVEPNASSNDLPIGEHNLAVEKIVVDVEETGNDEVSQLESIFVVSSDEEESQHHVLIKNEPIETDTCVMQPDQFGDEVGLQFLRRGQGSSTSESFDRRKERRGTDENFSAGDEAHSSDDWEDGSNSTIATNKRRKKYRRLDKYSRDGRYYPGPDARNNRDEDDHLNSRML